MRPLRVILLVSAGVLFLFLVFPPETKVRSFAHAIAAYDNDPTPENKKKLEIETAAVQTRRQFQLATTATLFGSNLLVLIYMMRRHHVAS